MKKEELAEAFGDISENYLKEAETIQRAGRPVPLKWLSAAACLCLIIGLAAAMLHSAHSDQGQHGGLTQVDAPVYDVVEYSVPADYPSADLYIATTADLVEYDAFMAENHGDRFSGKGIRVFTFSEGTAAEEFNVWYPDCGENGITRIYHVTKSGDKLLTAWREAGDLGRALEALASETSADTPMYLAQDGEMLFAVIGKTAYYLPDFTVMKPEISQMPAIRTEGLETRTVVLPLGRSSDLP